MPPRAGRNPIIVAESFAPGHVSAIFRPEVEVRDPRGRGSTGAGFTLELGARALAVWRPGPRRRIRVDAEPALPVPISEEVAERIVGEERGALRVRVRHELPVGQGFGMSASGALAVALAVGRAVRWNYQRTLEVAHLADLFGRGGLGGVASVLGGGLELRERAGIPPWGYVRHREWAGRVFVSVLGPPIPSPHRLSDAKFLDRVAVAAEPSMAALRRSFTPRTLFAEAERFGDAVGGATPEVAEALGVLRGGGVRAAQTMFGNAVHAVAETPASEAALLAKFEVLGAGAVALRSSPHGAAAWRLPPAAGQSLLNGRRRGAPPP